MFLSACVFADTPKLRKLLTNLQGPSEPLPVCSCCLSDALSVFLTELTALELQGARRSPGRSYETCSMAGPRTSREQWGLQLGERAGTAAPSPHSRHSSLLPAREAVRVTHAGGPEIDMGQWWCAFTAQSLASPLPPFPWPLPLWPRPHPPAVPWPRPCVPVNFVS